MLRSRLHSKTFQRYLVVGSSIYLFEMATILVAQRLGASPFWAVALSYGLGTLLAFSLQKFVTFGDRRHHHRVILSQLLATAALVAWNLLFTLLLTKLLQSLLPTIVIRTLAIATTTLWNYYLYKTSIFKSPAELVY